MQDGFPITVALDKPLKSASKLAAKIEAWINFQALTAGWFGDESQVLNFEFTIVTSETFIEHLNNPDIHHWTVAENHQYAFIHHSNDLQTKALITLSQQDVGDVEQALKGKLATVANLVVREYGLAEL